MPEFAECCGLVGFSEGIWSERRDLNSGPPVPQTGALTGLRYAPTDGNIIALIAERCNNVDEMGISSTSISPTSADTTRQAPTGVRPLPLAICSLLSHTGAPPSQTGGLTKLANGAPMLGKITKATVERLPLGQMLWDQGLNGFGARRQRKHVHYLLRYRHNGRQRFITIGRHGSPWTPDTARTEAQRLLGLVASRTDPANERIRPAETFGAEIDRYLERRRSSLKPRSFEEVERHLMAHAKPLHRLRLAEIDRRTIALRLAEIESESGPVARNRVRSSLSAFFAFAIREGLLEINPVTGTGKADEGHSRDRVLSQTELARIWAALGEDQFSHIVRLLMLTGQRRDEIGGLRWSEIDFDRSLIVLPPARTKNNRQHELPISKQVRSILERQSRRNEFVWGRKFTNWSDSKADLDQRLNGADDFRLHDLRRTAATMMADSGVLPHIIEAILNHVSGHKSGVAGIYNRARYEGEMRSALQRWADYIDGLR